MEMKIGTRVEIVEHTFVSALVGCTGTIIEEKIPESQWAMLCGKTNWAIQLDTPLILMGETIREATVREDSLALI